MIDDELVKARICSRVLDEMQAAKILKETVKDCDGDFKRAKKLIREYIEEPK